MKHFHILLLSVLTASAVLFSCTSRKEIEFKELVKTEVTPSAIMQNAEGNVFIDFGKAAFGQIKLTFDSPSSDTVIVHLGEKREGDGVCRDTGGSIRYTFYELPIEAGLHEYEIKFRPDPRNTAEISDSSLMMKPILMPESIGEVYPFRYCEIEGLDGTLKSAVQLAVHYPFDDEASMFESSDTVLNQVWDLCKYSMKATSYLGYYVDGDRERIAYEADALINQLSHFAVDCEYGMSRRTLERLMEYATWPTEWHLQMPLVAWNDYLYSGDISFLEKYYDKLKLKTLSALVCDNGLISTRTGKVTRELLDSLGFHGKDMAGFRDIVDWPQAGAGGLEKESEGEADGFVFSDYNTVVNAFHYQSLVCMGKIADALGKTEDTAQIKAEAESFKKVFNELLLDPSAGRYRDGIGIDHYALHSNMLPLEFGMVPSEFRSSVIEWVKSRKMGCSVYGAQFLLESMYDCGEAEYALSLLNSTALRSWYNMIRVGSTVTLEAWDQSFKPNLDWNHAWGAAPANIIQRKLVGVEPVEPGFSKVRVNPQPGSLEWFKSRVPTPYGPIEVEYHKDKGYEVKSPRGVKVI